MRETTFLILAALRDGPLHGYAIVGRVADLTDHRVRLAAGTLYGALDRLVGLGLVTAGEPYTHGGRPRRDYTLTVEGGAAVVAEARRMSDSARIVLGAGPAESVS